MKRAVILHAMEQDSSGHWYPWLAEQLRSRGYEVWVPDLPSADRPDDRLMTKFLLENKAWDWTDNLVIGHSSGAVEILHLLPKLTNSIATGVLIGSFDHVLWDNEHARLFTMTIDYPAVKNHARHFIIMHGDDDPWCPLEGAKHITDEVDGELVIVHGAGHFSTSLDPAFTQIPQLIDILESRKLL